MPEIIANTHSMIVAAGGATTATETLLGTITLPAGGPWLVHNVFGQVVAATATAAERTGGHFRFDVASGDLTPNPAPSRFPCAASSASLGATINRAVCPLHLYPVEWEAAGKAVINVYGVNHNTSTVAPQWVVGMIFGKTAPEILPIQFIERVNGSVIAAADTALGTILLAEKATRITGVCGIIQQHGVVVAGEELLGFFRFSSDDLNLPPSQFPFNAAYGAGLGVTIYGGDEPPIHLIPVDFPVPAGARINVNVDLNTAVTNATDCSVYIAYR